MKKANWEIILGQIDDALLTEAMSYSHPRGTVSRRKLVLLAAVLSLLCALGLTACAANLFGIRDLLMEYSRETCVTVAGRQDSPEYQALLEWTIKQPRRQQLRGPVEEDPLHHQYGAYTYRAKEMLDGILEKYNLQPYDQWTQVYDGDPQSLYDAVGMEDFLPESCAPFRGTTDQDSPGCSVRSCGTVYTFSDRTMLSGNIEAAYEFNNIAKGYLPIFLGMLIDPEAAETWEYRAKDGTHLLLCIDNQYSVILGDLPNSFLTISANTEAGDGSRKPLTKEQLEEFAALFDYSKIRKLSEP